jgi:hypothetical protein
MSNTRNTLVAPKPFRSSKREWQGQLNGALHVTLSALSASPHVHDPGVPAVPHDFARSSPMTRQGMTIRFQFRRPTPEERIPMACHSRLSGSVRHVASNMCRSYCFTGRIIGGKNPTNHADADARLDLWRTLRVVAWDRHFTRSRGSCYADGHGLDSLTFFLFSVETRRPVVCPREHEAVTPPRILCSRYQYRLPG